MTAADPHAAPRRPRLAVVAAEAGIPSEIWIDRQIAGMPAFDPVLVAWRRAPDPGWGAGRETLLVPAPFAPSRTLARRLRGRLGDPRAVLPDAAGLHALRGTLLAARPDVILCHFAWTAIPVAAALADMPGAPPVVAQVHGRDVSALLRRADYRRALARTLPRLARLVAVGRFQIGRLKALAAAEGVAMPPTEVIPCGAPTALFAARPPPERAGGDPVRFVSVGRLSPEKGVLESLAAFERVSAALEAAGEPAPEWLCIGDGPQAAELRAAVAASPAGARIRLAGRLAPEAVAEALSSAHVFVQHSREAGGSVEGFGVSLTEAGAAGLPLVASELGGIPDQLAHGENGFLFPPGDAAAQAARMLELATDEPLRRRMGAAAREAAARFDADRMSARLEAALLAAAGGSQRGGERGGARVAAGGDPVYGSGDSGDAPGTGEGGA